MFLHNLFTTNFFQLLFLTTIGLSLVLTGLKGFYGLWYAVLFRFVLLFSYLIPISLRVNMDLGKVFYCFQMKNDKVRTL